ncbi:MAG: hypothetical protein FWD06_04080 [Oscillospiraceae bacterium]|nr:hypothetical protein [Oscillospiraceae bacterium]
MKKLLSLLLIVTLLLSFAVLAAAVDPKTQPSLQAQGEALLRETLDIFANEEFTLHGAGFMLTQSGERIAIEEPVSSWLRWRTGRRVHIRENGNIYVAFPDRRISFDMTTMPFADRPLFALIDSTMPTHVDVTLHDNTLRVACTQRIFFFRDAQLQGAIVTYNNARHHFTVYSLVPTADHSLLQATPFPRWVSYATIFSIAGVAILIGISVIALIIWLISS